MRAGPVPTHSWPFFASRAVNNTCMFCFASARHIANPIPELPPVTRPVFPAPSWVQPLSRCHALIVNLKVAFVSKLSLWYIHII